jgi:hypothetical protein
MDDIEALWNLRTAHGSTQCDACTGMLALSVGASSYRWCCGRCGRKSMRFTVDESGVAHAAESRDPAFSPEAIVRSTVAKMVRARHARRPVACGVV